MYRILFTYAQAKFEVDKEKKQFCLNILTQRDIISSLIAKKKIGGMSQKFDAILKFSFEF